uniref:Pre-mRNA-splicing factor 38 n=1 Tax=Pseudo-nitzschia australis TaxID=44445 RepID=A0A7S4AFA4_9STRA|mmetsp:Transcript_22063/g.46780  ORF Transcript_22063/g.46780 Transcript_22063/m.46780 type:complete len:378 (+) Transcript_22063:106-1239(+)|eukprot:CAMPEP_0168258812 /NCGR_PEP_ID=MMETSP0141_2-20121125/7346_1 /TAXON_ID=44445 /ORGANISM="Pseudo-nitzschia australis, Strain 10249 10 AB" /LENGTH=377 /DNA_ID=CAMNT_0008196121 /DNA_START=42 /DNA_END=1175 /DNA_ORIENTATION=-
MANVTDPLIKSVQGSDPQNLMEYITRQKIYESRFWKEECFGLTAADVMERAAGSLTCVGGVFSGMGRPTKFLSLTLKLLQLQPELELVRTFVEQDHFKYLRALGAFYLRLTGRPQTIYELLDPLYADCSKLKYRGVNEWELKHVDEFTDELLTKPFCCGIAMPRLPARETLQEAGYLEEGPRVTALHEKLIEAGGVKEYLAAKVDEEVRARNSNDTNDNSNYSSGAISLWEQRYGKVKTNTMKLREVEEEAEGNDHSEAATNVGDNNNNNQGETSANLLDTVTSKNSREDITGKRKAAHADSNIDSIDIFTAEKKKKKKKKSEKYGSLFKSSAKDKKGKGDLEEEGNKNRSDQAVDQNSDEYWNNLRSSLGMNPLKK